MFITVGILSILAGIFVFRQASILSVLSGIVKSELAVAGAFSIVALVLIISGALGIACKNGEKRGMVIACILLYLLGTLAAITNYNAGDMKIWTYVCGVVAFLYFAWLVGNPKLE